MLLSYPEGSSVWSSESIAQSISISEIHACPNSFRSLELAAFWYWLRHKNF